MKYDFLPEPVCCDVCKGVVGYIEYSKNIPNTDIIKMVGFWKCKIKECGALVTCHPNTKLPVGYMALSRVRSLRTICHKSFDLLWSKTESPWSRESAYLWLSQILNIPREVANISKLTEDQLLFLIDESKKMIIQHRKVLKAEIKASRKGYRDKKSLNLKHSHTKQKSKIGKHNYDQFS